MGEHVKHIGVQSVAVFLLRTACLLFNNNVNPRRLRKRGGARVRESGKKKRE